MRDCKKTFKKVMNVIGTVAVILIVLAAVFLMGSRIAGYRVFTVISGSMEPKYSVGDLIYVKPTQPEEIKVGDAITFVLNEDLVVATHRVVGIDEEGGHFYTKGDANDDPDLAPVSFKNLIGKPIFSIPLLGYVAAWIQNPPGTYIVIALGIILVALMFLPDLFEKIREAKTLKSEDKGKEKGKEKEQSSEADGNTAEEELQKTKNELAKAKAELEALKASKEEKDTDAKT